MAASFRGAPFHVEEAEGMAAGRRWARHEYPGRDGPYLEDMGRRTKTFTIEAFIVGDDYADGRKRLIAACDMPGHGELIHPYRGSLTVACEGCTLVERTREGRMARFALSFTEAGANQYPTSTSGTDDVTEAAATSAVAAAISEFVERFGL